MAKANVKTAPTPEIETVVIELPADFEFEVFGHKLTAKDAERMSPQAIAYVFGNGYSQSMTDSGAMSKEAKKGKSEAELSKLLSDKRAARHAAILAGTVGAVRGTRATPIDKFIREVATERVRVIATTRNVPMPKGKVLAAALAAVIAKQGGDIRMEAEARMASAKASADALGDVDWSDVA